MNNIKALSVSLALLLGVGTLALGQASASPLSGNINRLLEQRTANIELVDHRSDWWMYDGGHRDWDDGVWLGATAPLYAYDDDDFDDHGSAHVEWCLSHYRSYDPASDTFLGYDGLRRRCNSPF